MRLFASCRDDKVASQLSPEDKQLIESSVDDTLDWLDNNQHLAEVEEFERRMTGLEGVCIPIIAKMYGAGEGSAGLTV